MGVLSDLDTISQAASNAMLAGDYAEARLQANAGLARIAGAVSAKSGDEEYTFGQRDHDRFTALLREIDRAQNVAAGFRRITPF